MIASLGREPKKIASLFLVLFVLTFFVPLLSKQNPIDIDLEKRLSSPSSKYLFGTDELGRDVFSRVLHGFATTTRVSIVALLFSLCIGIFIGGLSGYFYNTWIDKIFNWIVSLIFSLPFLLIMASIMSLIKPSIYNAYLILALIMWPSPARIVRAEVAKIKQNEYVTALRSYGFSEMYILSNAILPASLKSVLIFSISYLPEIIGLEAGLSFIGLGVQPPYPGLGKMIFDGLNYLYSSWWLSFFPALILTILVMIINLYIIRIKK